MEGNAERIAARIEPVTLRTFPITSNHRKVKLTLSDSIQIVLACITLAAVTAAFFGNKLARDNARRAEDEAFFDRIWASAGSLLTSTAELQAVLIPFWSEPEHKRDEVRMARTVEVHQAMEIMEVSTRLLRTRVMMRPLTATGERVVVAASVLRASAYALYKTLMHDSAKHPTGGEARRFFLEQELQTEEERTLGLKLVTMTETGDATSLALGPQYANDVLRRAVLELADALGEHTRSTGSRKP